MNDEEKKDNKGKDIRSDTIKAPDSFTKKKIQTTMVKAPSNITKKEIRSDTITAPSCFLKKSTPPTTIKVPYRFKEHNKVLINQKSIDYSLKHIRVKNNEIYVRNANPPSKSVTLINRNKESDQNKVDFSLEHFKKNSAEKPLTPSEWGKIKRQLWKQIYSFIIKNQSIITNIETNSRLNDDDKLKNIKKLIFNILENKTDLLLIDTINGQEKPVSDFVQQYITSIWLMNKNPPSERKIIRNMSGLEYKIIKQIADYLEVNIPKTKTGTPIDSDALKKILAAIKHEISIYNQGLEPKSLNKIGKDLNINQSVISYYGNLYYPKKYDEIWGRNEDWRVSEEIRSKFKRRINEEIKKFENGQIPASLKSIAEDFSKYVSYSTGHKIVKDEFPEHYLLIWKSNFVISKENKEMLYKKLDEEIKKEVPETLSGIGRTLEISYDMVRHYAKKRYPNRFDGIWGLSQTTEGEIEAIQDRFQQEIEKFEKFKEKTILYDKFTQKFDITKNKVFKPDSITEIANDFNKSPDTISRIFTKNNLKKYDEIYAKHRLTEEQQKSIISDIICTKLPQTGLAEKHNASTGTITRISLEKVQPNYDDYDHSERFPHDIYQQLGFAIHSIIECISTRHLLEYDIRKFSEIPYGDYVMDDFLPHHELHKFYKKLIIVNKERFSLWEEIGLNLNDYYEIVFDYTSYISKKQYQNKTKKYYNPKRMIIIVGTRWYDEKYPNSIIHTSFENVKIIRHDIFAKLIGLSGLLLKEFEIAIRINYDLDLDGMNAFKDKITQKYSKLGFIQYKKYCEKHPI